MGKTSIEWTDKVWNPTRGCSRVSEGCRECYAERQAARFANAPKIDYAAEIGERVVSPGGIFHGFVTRVNGHPAWTGKVELIESKLTEPLHWKKPCRIFVNSMSDLFHERLSFEDIDRVFTVMVAANWHTYQILTKRADRMREYFRSGRHDRGNGPDRAEYHLGERIWLGVSVEDQQRADERIALLLETPAAVRFVSYEPALGPVDFFHIGAGGQYTGNALGAAGQSGPPIFRGQKLDWIICGGESGPDARPFDLAWARSARDQCRAASVSFFFKQAGSKPLLDNERLRLHDSQGGDPSEWPEDLRIREFPQIST